MVRGHGAVKVCMLVMQHPFVDARIFKREAKSLVKAGYDVTVVVPRNRNGYMYNIDGTPYTDKFLEPAFIHEGVRFVTYQPRATPLEKMRSNVYAKGHQPFADPLFQKGLAMKADIYHVHEVYSLYSGVGIKRAIRRMYGKTPALIYDSNEITEGSAAYVAMFQRMMQEVDAVVAVSDSMAALYAKSFPTVPVTTLYNSPPLDAAFRPKRFDGGALTAGYIGYMSQDKGNQAKMYGILEQSERRMNLKFKVLGGVAGRGLDVPSHLRERVEQTGWIDYERIPDALRDVDVGWIDFNLDSTVSPLNYKIALPNKFFSYLNSGVPVVVNHCPEMAAFVRKHQCGLVVPGNNPIPLAYANAIAFLNEHRDVLATLSANARRAMEKTYSWENMEQRLQRLYQRLAKRHG